MPSVDVAMVRSLRGGLWGTLTQGLTSNLSRRNTLEDLQNSASEAKTAFSSWDNCMQATFCKWPVIAIIIIGGLIIFSIVWCLARCLCCGLSCCCECCYCLKCCGNCLGCCDPPKGRAHKYLDNETLPPTHGYRAEPPMKAPVMSPVRTAPVYEPPQYAEFEVTKKGGEDSLPSMPVWNEASSKKATLEPEAVEMNQLSRTATGQQTVASASAAAAASAAAVAAAAGQPSPGMSGGHHSPYRQPSPIGPTGYATPAGASAYANQASPQGYGNGYSQTPAPYGADPYIAAAAVPNSRMASPHQDYRGNGYNQGYGNGNGNGQSYPDAGQGYANGYDNGQAGQAYDNGHVGQSYDNGQAAYGGDYGHPAAAYGMDPRRASPASAAYAAEPLRHSPAPQAGYGYGQQQQPQQQQQQYGAAAGYRQPQSQQPQLQNAGGFDFNSGYSRPQEYNNYRQPSPVEVQPQELPASSGYSAYSPTTTQRNNGY